ncbi:MAG TPA: hypothetical protein GXX19_09640 [Syntrophomonadaceae bacterium]|nr:hypothetical protein [Syntrophomonadaceae bacterium]
MHRVRIPFAGLTKFIEAVFEIEEKDRKKIEERFGQGVLASNLVAFKRDFSGILYWKIDYNEKIAVQRIVSDLHLANGSNNLVI